MTLYITPPDVTDGATTGLVIVEPEGEANNHLNLMDMGKNQPFLHFAMQLHLLNDHYYLFFVVFRLQFLRHEGHRSLSQC